MLHSPVQIWAPHANSCFREDPRQARETRRRVLTEAADTRSLVFPAHFPGPGAARIRHDGEHFTVREWAPIDRVQTSGKAVAGVMSVASPRPPTCGNDLRRQRPYDDSDDR